MRTLMWAVLPLFGCSLFWRAPTPMRAIDYPLAQPPARCLVVLLPGMGDDAEAFSHHGLVDDLERQRLSIDVVAANATIGYYTRGTFAERLASDVIEPRRQARGYQQ